MEDKKKTKWPYDEEDDRELFDDLYAVASSTECTGLMPTPATSEPEANSYSQIYDIPLSVETTKDTDHDEPAPKKPKKK